VGVLAVGMQDGLVILANVHVQMCEAVDGSVFL